MSPRVSVVIPTRNRADDLRARVSEIANQSLPDHELVIVDDGSEDHTPSVAELAAAADERVRYVRLDPPLGMPRVLQRAVDEAGADLVAIFHDHDSYAPTVLDRLASALGERPDAAFAFCSIFSVDPASGRRQEMVHPAEFGAPGDVLSAFVRSGACPVCASATLLRKNRLPAVAFEPGLGLFADVPLWCRLSATSPSPYVPEPLVSVQGWDETESLTKLNWEIIGKLASLRRQLVASHMQLSGAQAVLLRGRIRLAAAVSRGRFVIRLLRHASRNGPVPENALRGLPRPLTALTHRLGGRSR
jgi:glycosyltransferase involved in cell wall biosynthesis